MAQFAAATEADCLGRCRGRAGAPSLVRDPARERSEILRRTYEILTQEAARAAAGEPARS
jgi:hypothetical protein